MTDRKTGNCKRTLPVIYGNCPQIEEVFSEIPEAQNFHEIFHKIAKTNIYEKQICNLKMEEPGFKTFFKL
jgi:hypothetical protein